MNKKAALNELLVAAERVTTYEAWGRLPASVMELMRDIEALAFALKIYVLCAEDSKHERSQEAGK